MLQVVEVADGSVLGTMELASGGDLRCTGSAASLITRRFRDRTPQQIFDHFNGWSNGYVQVKPVDDSVAAAAGAAGEARPLTPEEQAAGLDPDAIAAELQAAQQEVTSQWEDLAEPVTAGLVAAVGAALAAGALAELGSLTVDAAAVDAIAGALASSMLALAGTAAERAAGELRRQGVTLDPGTPDEVALRLRADATALLLAQGYASSASKAALLHASPDVEPRVVEQAVRAQLNDLTASADGGDPSGFVADTVTSVMLAAQAEGRHATHSVVAERSGIRWASTEVMDRSTCSECRAIDGTLFETYAEARTAYPTGRYRACLGRDRCRGLIYGRNDTDRNRLLDT